MVQIIGQSNLTHKLPVKIYAAWVLILQVSAYVAYLEFGIQSGISKFVAEYEARNDSTGSSMRASAGLALMVIASAAGVVLTLILAWRVPELFTEMPASLYRDVRFSIIFVGISLSFGLLSSVFSSIFFGLQRYAVPIFLSIVNRTLFTVLVLAAVAFHQSLAMKGALVAAANVTTGLLQFEAWRRLARNVRLSLRGLDLAIMKTMFAYCSSLAIWTAGMLCVSGPDVTIVGRYDFGQTAVCAIAVLPTNFMTAIIGAAIAPLMPAASALSVHRSPLKWARSCQRPRAIPRFSYSYPGFRCWSEATGSSRSGSDPCMPRMRSHICESLFWLTFCATCAYRMPVCASRLTARRLQSRVWSLRLLLTSVAAYISRVTLAPSVLLMGRSSEPPLVSAHISF